jgi:hypothetical protein
MDLVLHTMHFSPMSIQQTPAQLGAHLTPRREIPAEMINYILRNFSPDLKESVRACMP